MSRFTENLEEIEATLKLRFEVFNLELEGLATSFLTGRDRDEFDATSRHLIAAEKATGRIVGTYRLRTARCRQYHRVLFAAGNLVWSVCSRCSGSSGRGRSCVYSAGTS